MTSLRVSLLKTGRPYRSPNIWEKVDFPAVMSPVISRSLFIVNL